jgi:hypothetical protein
MWRRIKRHALHFVKDSCDPAAMRERLGEWVEEAVARKEADRAAPGKAGTRAGAAAGGRA